MSEPAAEVPANDPARTPAARPPFYRRHKKELIALGVDEPTAGLSRSETGRFTALIRRLTRGRTLLTIEHDMDVVFGLADRIAVLVQGRLLCVDTPSAVRADPRVQEAYLGAVPLPAHSPRPSPAGASRC